MKYSNIHGRDPLQTPLASNSTQPSSKDQPRSPNGFFQGPQSFISRSSQPEALGEGLAASRHSPDLQNFSRLEARKGQVPQDGFAHTRASRSMENADAHVNFDFSGGQLPVMRSQLPGISQPQPRSVSRLSDIQLIQQQYFCKQLQGLQERHLQQLDQEPRQQNSVGQFSPFAKQVEGDHIPAFVNGTPIHDASNYMWTNERVAQIGGDAKMLNGSQPFMFGNSNMFHMGSPALHGFPSGLVLSPDQTHAFPSMGVTVHQIGQTTYGASLSGLKEASSYHVNPYSSLQWGDQENANILTRSTGNRAQNAVMQYNDFLSFKGDQSAPLSGYASLNDVSAPKQNIHGRNVLGQVPHVIQNANGGADVGIFQQAASLTRNLRLREEFHGRQEGWMGNVEEKATSLAGHPQQLVTLDPLEEKILYGGDRPVWDACHGGQPLSDTAGRVNSMGAGSFMQGNQLEGSNHFSMFPSTQSGSWSALMQSAVAEASSSDTGVQDEWSGLSLQNPELSTGNRSDLSDSGRLSVGWGDRNTQTANSFPSRPLHLFDDTTMNSNSKGRLGFQRNTTKLGYDHHGKGEGDICRSHGLMGKDGPSEEARRLTKEVAWLEQTPLERSMVDGAVQTPLTLGNASSGACRSHAYHHQPESVPRPVNMDLDASSMQSSWAHQQQTSMVNFEADGQTGSKSSIWNINEPLPSDGDATQDNYNLQDRHPQSDESLVAMHLGRDHDVNMYQAVERGVLQKNSNQGLTCIPNLSGRFGQPKPSSSPQLQNDDSNANSFNPIPGLSSRNLNQVNYQQVQHDTHKNSRGVNDGPGDSSTLNYSNQQKIVASVVTDNMRSTANDSLSLTRSQKFHIHPMQKNTDATGSRQFLYLPMGELAMNYPQPSTMKHELLSRGVQQVGVDAHSAANSEKGSLERNLQNNGKRLEDASSKQITHDYNSSAASLDESTAFPSKYRADSSQNMLQLLNKVDHSRENAGKAYISSGYSLTPGISKAAISDTAAARVQGNQLSSSQGFGLHLAPPSGASAVPTQVFPSHASSLVNSGLKSRDIAMEDATKCKAMQTLQHPAENARQISWNNRTDYTVTEHEVSTMANQDTNSKLQANHTIMEKSGEHYTPNYLQYQQMSGASGQAIGKASARAACASHMDPNKRDKSASGFRSHDSEDGHPVLGHSLQVEKAGKVASVGLHQCGENDFSSSSPFLDKNSSGMKGQNLPSNIGGQVSGPQGVPCSSFPMMLHNSWSNLSTQRNTSGVSEMVQRGPIQSVSPGTAWIFQAVNDQKLSGKAGGSTSEVGPTYTNLQYLPSREDQQNKESSSQPMLYKKAVASGSAASLGSLERESFVSHQKNDSENRLRHDYSQASKIGSITFQRTPENAASSQSNYSLLHQMHAIKSSEDGPKNAGNRFIGENDSQLSNVAFKIGQKSPFGYGSSTNDIIGASERTLENAPHPIEDTNNLRFSLEDIKSQNTNTSSHIIATNSPKQDTLSLEKNMSQIHPFSHIMLPAKPSVKASGHPHPNPQMAGSWFEPFGTYENGQFVTTPDRFAVPQKSTSAVGQQFFFGRVSGSTLPHTVVEQRSVTDAKQIGSVMPMQSSIIIVSTKEQAPSLHSSLPDASHLSWVAVKRKKRKRASSISVPWNKVVAHTSQGLHSISTAELQWASATNRLIEKLDDEADMGDDGLLVPRPRKRIIFTTQLIQQIFCPVSAAILSAEATLECETVTYMVAKLLLGDACSLVSSLSADLRAQADNITSVKIGGCVRSRNQSILKLVEGFLDKARNLENDLLRLQEGNSMLDVRVECQDLERFSIINRFARFHGGPGEVVSSEGSVAARVVPSLSFSSSSISASSSTFSSSDAVTIVPRKIFPQRYVTAVPMPRNLPEGLQCHSL